MDKTGHDLLKLLFNEGETVCVSNSKACYYSVPLERVFSSQVTLVPPEDSEYDLKPFECDSSNLILCALNPISGRCKDENVTAFRSFLIEIDIGSIKEQLGTIEHLKMPFSAQVFSGSKSIHTVITLDRDLPDEKTYRTIAEWIFNIVRVCDKNCKNPSRRVRIPGAYRAPGKKQRLRFINKRISHKELFDWLEQWEHLRPKGREEKEILTGTGDFDRLPEWVRNQLKYGFKPFHGSRNQTWYRIFLDCKNTGYSKEEAIGILGQIFAEEHDFKEKEWFSIAKSVYG